MKQFSHSPNKFLVGIVAFVLGLLIVIQLKLKIKIEEFTGDKKTATTVQEVQELIKNNKKLLVEYNQLSQQESQINNTFSTSQQKETSMTKELEKYQIISGAKAISGAGVQIQFEKDVAVAQIVDLVNTLRNIGAEAIQFNDKRVLYNTDFGDEDGRAPLTINAIGKANVIKSSLLRRGGIIEQIDSSAKVDIVEKLTIKAR